MSSRYDAMLIQAVSQRDRGQVLQLHSDFEASVNASTKNGSTGCHIATVYGDLEMLKLLMKLGADINQKDESIVGGFAPLHYAIEQESIDVVRVLLENGAKVNLKTDKCGFTPLILTARKNDTELAGLLLKYGANVHLTDKNGFTASYWAESRGFDAFVTDLKLPTASPPDIRQVTASLQQIPALPKTLKAKKKGKKSKAKK